MADSEDYVADLTPDAHAASHESGGSDQLDITGLTPADHASRHESGGDDEINISGLVGSGSYVDRGDPAALDLQVGSFTTNGDEQVLDLSSIIGTGEKLVHIRIRLRDGLVGTFILFKKNGNSNDMNIWDVRTQVVDVFTSQSDFVACDAAGKIAYRTTNTPITTLDFTVRGWIVL